MALGDQQVFDSGLQLERTALSWQRTLLSLAVGSLAVGRGLEPLIGWGSWLIATAGLALAGVAFAASRRRYVRAHDKLTSAGGQTLPADGAMIAAAAALAVVIGIAALVFTVSRLLNIAGW